MRFLLSKLFLSFALLALVLTSLVTKASAQSQYNLKASPDYQIGAFHLLQPTHPYPLTALISDGINPEDYGVTSGGAAKVYVSESGEGIGVILIPTRSDSDAYALLSKYRAKGKYTKLDGVGTYGILSAQTVIFFKGPTLALVRSANERASDDTIINFARLLADTLDKGEGDIPVLVKHLPNWEQAEGQAVYAVTQHALQEAAGNRPVLDAVSFEGGTEAVTATYGPSRMVLVEYTTPQIASDSDARIQAKIKELRDAGQPLPTAYKRVGNYSVFVFDAPDEQTAERLINGVTYEQVVQWLGENPHLLERAQRYYTQVTSGVLMAVLKASGLSVLLCFGVGGLFGWLVFKRRRARQAVVNAYSDAGGIVRLNLDELTPQTDSSRLLGKRDG